MKLERGLDVSASTVRRKKKSRAFGLDDLYTRSGTAVIDLSRHTKAGEAAITAMGREDAVIGKQLANNYSWRRTMMTDRTGAFNGFFLALLCARHV